MRRKLIVAMLSGILCACPIEVYADAEMTQEETDMNSLSEEEYKKNVPKCGMKILLSQRKVWKVSLSK